MSSPSIDTTYVFGSRTRPAHRVTRLAADPRFAPDTPRTLCGVCGRPVPGPTDLRGLPEFEGAWLCWGGDGHATGLAS